MNKLGTASGREAWNKGRRVGQWTPFKLQEIWAIRIRLQMPGRLRELAHFDLGIDRHAARLRPCQAYRRTKNLRAVPGDNGR